MKKHYVALVTVVLVLVAGMLYFLTRDTKFIIDDITLYVYTVGGEPTGVGAVSVPFSREDEARRWLSVAFGEGGERVVESLPAKVAGDTQNRLNLALPEDVSLAEGSMLPIALALTPDSLSDWNGEDPGTGYYLQTQARVAYAALDERITTEGWEPGLMRGAMLPQEMPLVPRAHAESHFVDVDTPLEMPDTTQDTNECAPTAASNSLTGLARAHDREDDLPDTEDMIEELKEDMNFADGVAGPRNFIVGKNTFATRHNLPIQTRELTELSIDAIAEVIEDGCAVEADLGIFETKNGRSVQTGNHMVNITGAYRDSETSALRGLDPGNGDSVELWRFRPSDPWPYINYSWTKSVVIKHIYVQCWIEEEAAAHTGTQDESEGTIGEDPKESEDAEDSDEAGDDEGESTDEARGEETSGEGTGGSADASEQGGREVEMFVMDGVDYYPAHQFHVAGPDACDTDHYHIDGGVAYGLAGPGSLEVVSKRDPNPRGCGFGRVGELPSETITISHEQGLELVKYLVD